MLSIGRLALAQTEYYERSVAAGQEDYYAGRGEAPGRWVGAGAEGLGLSGRVSREAFERLMAGRDPRSGEQLVRRRRKGAVAALDLTFSAPKSVSVLFAVGGEELAEALVDAHERAVAAGLAYLEEHACEVRRGHDGVVRERAVGFVAAAYRHRMSRLQDPQLHTHCVTANMAQGEDGRWTALHGRVVFAHAKAAGFVYQAELRRAVSEALPWARWGQVTNGMSELDGVDEGMLVQFSRRRVQILEREAELAASGVAVTDRGRELIAHDTREVKEAIDNQLWREAIRARAADYGFGREELERLLAGEPAGRESDLAEVWGAQAEVLVDAEGLTARRNAFSRREVTMALAQAAAGGATREQLEVSTGWFVARDEVLELAGEERDGRYSVAGLVVCEQAILDAGRAGERELGVLASAVVEQTLAGLAVALTAEQRDAVRAVCGSGRRVEVIQALAGTGKTTTAGAIAAAYKAAGYPVIGIAPTARAVRELKDRAAVGRSFTLTGALMSFDRDGTTLPRGSVVLLDEASMASTREVAELVERARRTESKVIAIGDGGQLPSVQAGGWFGALAGREDHPICLREVMRQRDAHERLLLERLHGGSPDGWVHAKLDAGRLHVAPAEEAIADAVRSWQAHARQVGLAQAVMIARSNDTRRRLNAEARKLRAAELGPARVFGSVELAVGDRVVCRRNSQRVDVDNGMRGTVSEITDAGAVLQTDAGATRLLPTEYVSDSVEHAYALTGHSAQGGTVQWSAVIASPHELTRNWSYTALSRAREPSELIIIDDEDTMDQAREEIAPGEITADRDALAEVMATMRRRDDQDLAVDQLQVTDDGVEAFVRSQRSADDRTSVAKTPAEELELNQLRHEIADVHAQVTRARNQQDAPAVDPKFERLLANQRALRAELARRRDQHVREMLADPPAGLISTLGAAPTEPIARQRWDVRARQFATLQFDSGTADPPAGPQAPGDSGGRSLRPQAPGRGLQP